MDRNGKTKKDKKRDREIDKQVQMKDWMEILRQKKALVDYLAWWIKPVAKKTILLINL